MKNRLISMVLLAAMLVATIGTGCGSLPKRGAPPKPPGAPAPPR